MTKWGGSGRDNKQQNKTCTNPSLKGTPCSGSSCRRTSQARGCIQISDTSRGDTPEIIQSSNFTCNAGLLWRRTSWWCFQRKQINTSLDSPAKRGQPDFLDDLCLEGGDTFACPTCYCALFSVFQLTLVLLHSCWQVNLTRHMFCVYRFKEDSVLSDWLLLFAWLQNIGKQWQRTFSEHK